MDTLIQVIKTEWTKKSRGSPGSTLRNSVPIHHPFIAHHTSGILLQKVNYYESDDFKEPYSKLISNINSNQLRDIRLELIEEDKTLKVKFWGTPIRPSYGKSKAMASLTNNSWLQIVGNVRVPYESTTGYNKYVYNIFYGEKEKANEIVNNSKPIKIYNEEVNLY